MFDTFMDLPLHVLVLHFAVVLLPLSATVTVAALLRPACREKFAAPVAALNVAMLALTFLTYKSGGALKDKLNPTGNPKGAPSNDHEEWAQILLWIMVALAVVAVIVWLTGRMEGMLPAAVTGLVLVAVGLAGAAAVMTVVTGHTGSKSHWGYLYDRK